MMLWWSSSVLCCGVLAASVVSCAAVVLSLAAMLALATRMSFLIVLLFIFLLLLVSSCCFFFCFLVLNGCNFVNDFVFHPQHAATHCVLRLHRVIITCLLWLICVLSFSLLHKPLQEQLLSLKFSGFLSDVFIYLFIYLFTFPSLVIDMILLHFLLGNNLFFQLDCWWLSLYFLMWNSEFDVLTFFLSVSQFHCALFLGAYLDESHSLHSLVLLLVWLTRFLLCTLDVLFFHSQM